MGTARRRGILRVTIRAGKPRRSMWFYASEPAMQDTRPLLLQTDFPPIARLGFDTLQVNVGYRCNQSCVHCHVNAGPTRTEQMDADTVALALEVIDARGVRLLDITGGAPELNPHFRHLVRE